MDIWNKIKSTLWLANDNGIDANGVDHSNMSIRDELEYQLKNVKQKDKIAADQRKRAVENDLLMDGMDVLYGINRTINGMSFGAMDWLGEKLGIDTKMNDYLNQKDAKSRKIAEVAGNVAEVGGAALMTPVVKTGYEEGNMAYNGYKIGKAYDKLKKDPYSGSGSDVIAKMKDHRGESVVLQRGEAIRGSNGEVIVHGKTLKREAGTERNYGLDKIIHKHDVPRSEVIKLPRYIKKEPVEITSRNRNIYSINTQNGEIITSTTPRDNYRTISSMYKKTK